MTHPTSAPPHLSTDPTKLDLDWIVAALRKSYWGHTYREDQILAAMNSSLCFGLYAADTFIDLQIGFARVLTDGAVLSAVTDVIIRDGWRRRGYGTQLMRGVIDHPAIKPTICILDCRPENEVFYKRLGFDRRRNVMQIDPR